MIHYVCLQHLSAHLVIHDDVLDVAAIQVGEVKGVFDGIGIYANTSARVTDISYIGIAEVAVKIYLFETIVSNTW